MIHSKLKLTYCGAAFSLLAHNTQTLLSLCVCLQHLLQAVHTLAGSVASQSALAAVLMLRPNHRQCNFYAKKLKMFFVLFMYEKHVKTNM